jgi:hypothetical protein
MNGSLEMTIERLERSWAGEMSGIDENGEEGDGTLMRLLPSSFLYYELTPDSGDRRLCFYFALICFITSVAKLQFHDLLCPEYSSRRISL